jgi:hypothetical protein
MVVVRARPAGLNRVLVGMLTTLVRAVGWASVLQGLKPKSIFELDAALKLPLFHGGSLFRRFTVWGSVKTRRALEWSHPRESG